jgi:hypothetical protein
VRPGVIPTQYVEITKTAATLHRTQKNQNKTNVNEEIPGRENEIPPTAPILLILRHFGSIGTTVNTNTIFPFIGCASI